MRDGMRDGILLTVVVLIAGAGIYLWASHVDPTRPLEILTKHVEKRDSESGPQAQPFPPAPPAAVTPKRVAKPTVVSRPLAVVVEPAPVVEASAPPPAAAPAPPAEPRPFPAVEQIQAGSHEEAITSAYGSPTVTTLTSSRGHVIENLVYARKGGHSAAVIQLEDGKVSSAYTKLEPPQVEGLSIPRPKPNQ